MQAGVVREPDGIMNVEQGDLGLERKTAKALKMLGPFDHQNQLLNNCRLSI